MVGARQVNDEHAAEIALLGALLIDPKLIAQKDPLVREPKILSATGQILYKAIVDCYEKHQTVDVVLAMSEVSNGNKERVQVLAATALNDCPMSKNARRYADVLERRALRSEAINSAIALEKAVQEGDSPARIREHMEIISELIEVKDEENIEPFDLQDVIDEPDKPVPWVIKGLLARRDFAIIAGEPGTGKSVFALDLALSLASGTEFLSTFKVERQFNVIYLDEEMAPLLARRRLKQLIVGRQLEPDDLALQYYNSCSISLDSPEGRLALRRICDSFKPDWIILDSLIRFHKRNENDNSEMSRFYEHLRALQKEYETGIIALHHLAKPSKDKSKELGHRLRGASDLRATVDQLWGIEGETRSNVRTLVHDKNRWGSTTPPMTMIWIEAEDASTATLKAESRSQNVEDKIVEMLISSGEVGCSRTTLITLLERDYTKASAERMATQSLGKLKAVGTVRQAKIGRRMQYWHKDHAPQRAFDEDEE
jgi:hypothetical protein